MKSSCQTVRQHSAAPTMGSTKATEVLYEPTSDETAPKLHDAGMWQAFVPELAWGTLLLLAGILLGYALVIPAAMQGYLPYPLATLVCAYLAYASFTVMHDAGHGSLIQVGSRLKKLEAMIGWLASIPLLIAPYRLFQKIHDRHHAFTNDPERDPDHYSFGDKWYLVVLNSLFIPLQYHIMSVTTLRHLKVIRATYSSSLLYLVLVVGSLAMLASSGYAREVMYFAVAPAIIAVFFLAMFFDYIPHHPHKSLGRYHNTRIFPGRIGNIVLLGQNYHLIHHLYPRVPWYRYVDVYQRILPELEARRAPIEDLSGKRRPAWLQSPDARNLQDEGRTLHHVLRVKEIEQLTPDALAISFELPEGQRLDYLAGQYITLSKWLNGQQQSRCYSLCSSPARGQLKVGVKHLPGGSVSGSIHKQLHVGDELVVQGPGGDFVYPPKHQQRFDHLLLVAGGSGITPILAILESALEDVSDTPVTLVYVSRDRAHCMFLKHLEALARQHHNRFKLYTLFSAENAATGHTLNADTLTQLLSLRFEDAKAGNLQKAECYVCGPEGLKQTVVETLSKQMVDPLRLHSEEFIAGITAPKGPQHSVHVTLADGQSHHLKVASNQTVLEVAKAKGVALPHACGTGTCGTCKLKLDKGDIVPLAGETPGLTAPESAAGFTLACQCRPLEALSLSESRF